MLTAARARYLLAMGLAPVGAIALAGCHRNATVDVGADDAAVAPDPAANDGAIGTSPPEPASADAASDTVDASAPVDASASASVDASVSLAATGQRQADAAVALVRPTTMPPTPPRDHLPTCPTHHYCEPAPKQISRPAPTPYTSCDGKAPHGGPLHESAKFSAEETQRARRHQPDACCYSYTSRCPGGRPLRATDGAPIVADVTTRADWSERVALAHLPRDVRDRLATHWRAEAAAEHASIASFARFSLQLLALGAPAHLVDGAHEAARDEIRHARACYAMVERYAGLPAGPSGLALPPEPLPVDPETVALETLRDGCLGESLAARIAEASAATASDLAARTTLRAIADDEDRHAELAWKTMAWLLERHPEPVRRALEAFAQTLDEIVVTADDEARDAANDEAHGVLGPRARRDLRLAVVRSVAAPCVAALLAQRPHMAA